MKITVDQALAIADELLKIAELARGAGQSHVETDDLKSAADLDDRARAELDKAIAEAQ